MEKQLLLVWVICSKRCLKRLESGSKDYGFEMCLFFLIW